MKLIPWTGGPPEDAGFVGDGPVLWLGPSGRAGWLEGLRTALGDRVWAPAMSVVSVPRLEVDRNPWAFRPDDHPPLRWGDPAADVRTLADVAGRPDHLGGVVLDGALDGLGAQAARALLSQVAELLPSGAGWLLVERNGRFLPEVVRNVRRPDSERGEGRSTVRTAEEIRRLVEVAGLGIVDAWGVPPEGRRGRLAVAVAGDVGAAWVMLRGRRA